MAEAGKRGAPSSFEEAQAGALVQLTTIAQRQRKLDELIRQFEADASANPKDIQKLETLAQVYALTQNTDKSREIIDRLLAASPNDPDYQGMRIMQSMGQNLDFGTFKKLLDEATALTPEVRLRHIAQFSTILYSQGKQKEAAKALDELDTANVTDLDTGSMFISVFTQQGKLDVAEKILAQLPAPAMTRTGQSTAMGMPSVAQQQWWQYHNIYNSLASAHIRDGAIEKGVELLWVFLDRTKPEPYRRSAGGVACTLVALLRRLHAAAVELCIADDLLQSAAFAVPPAGIFALLDEKST